MLKKESQKSRVISEQDLSEEIYTSFFSKPKIIIAIILVIGLGLFINFPIKSIVTFSLSSALTSSKNCPINFESIDTGIFFPKVIIKRPIVSGTCFGNPERDLVLSDIVFSFRGFSLSPFGLKFSLLSESEGMNIHAYVVASFSKQVIKLENTWASDSFFKIILQDVAYFQGLFSIEGLLTLESGSITESDFLVRSNNIQIPSQNAFGLQIPSIPLNSLIFKMIINSKTPQNNRLELQAGDDKSPLIAKFIGPITVNQEIFADSSIALKGEVKFSPEILSEFSLLPMLLSSYTKKNDFYQIRVDGILSYPRFSPFL